MSISTNMFEIARLKDALSLCVTKNHKKDGSRRSASIAYSKSNASYPAGLIESDTSLLGISSEQAALLLASQHNDFAIHHVVTLTEGDSVSASPITLKLLADFTARTGTPIRYTLLSPEGNIIFDVTDAVTAIPFYTVPDSPKRAHTEISAPIHQLTKTTPESLKEFALSGMRRAFTTYSSASAYGAVVATKNGNVYFAGQYSSFEKRTGLHAEMSALTIALMNNARDIESIAVVSTKYPNSPCPICGCCRQFISEIETKLGISISIISLAKETADYILSSSENLLPEQWSSGKWN